MLFASPIWLLGLLPWAAVVVYLLIGRGQPAVVPFLRFWKGPVRTSHKRSWRMPPVFLLLMLLAILLAVVAAAQPGYRAAAVDGDITIVLDCGATMARPGNGRLFRGVLKKAADELGTIHGKVSIIPVPGQRVDTTGEHWLTTATDMLPTAIPVNLDLVVVEQLQQTRGVLVVLSDQPLHISDPRLVQILPDPPKPEVAITLLAARSQLHPQVMVRLENHSELKSVRVWIDSKGGPDRVVALGPVGKSQDVFFDLPYPPYPTIFAGVDPQQQRDPWGNAFLAEQSQGIHLSMLGPVPASVEHIATVYSEDRHAMPDAPVVFITDHALGENQPEIWIDNSPGPDATGEVVTETQDVTKNVGAWPARGRRGAAPPGFTPVVSIGGEPLVAVRENPARQVWIRAELKVWENTVDFVVFFGNALDWIANAKQQFTAIAPKMLGRDWQGAYDYPGVPTGAWPGIFPSKTGRWLAVNAGDYPSTPPVTTSNTNLRLAPKIGQIISLLPAGMFGALLCVLVAVFVWPSNRISPARTDAGL